MRTKESIRKGAHRITLNRKGREVEPTECVMLMAGRAVCFRFAFFRQIAPAAMEKGASDVRRRFHLFWTAPGRQTQRCNIMKLRFLVANTQKRLHICMHWWKWKHCRTHISIYFAVRWPSCLQKFGMEHEHVSIINNDIKKNVCPFAIPIVHTSTGCHRRCLNTYT